MTDTELSDLEAKAKAATPGPWDVESYDKGATIYAVGPIGFEYYNIGHGATKQEAVRLEVSLADASFTSAANPATVLALIAEVRRLKSAPIESYAQAALVIQNGPQNMWTTGTREGDENFMAGVKWAAEQLWRMSQK